VSATTPIVSPPSTLATTALATNQIKLTWRDNATDETGFKIERKTGATGTWAQIATTGANVVTYTNTGLAANTTYYYRVRAYNASGNSPYSNEAYTATFIVNPPSTLVATALSATQIKLTWRDNATNETGFKIERKTGATGTWAQIATAAANVVTYTNTGLTTNTTYYYRVRAYNATGNSPYSNEAYTATFIVNPPSTLAATALSATQIKLTWTDNATNETGFKIERKTGATGTYAQIATVAANIVTYTNTGLTTKITYYYRVRAYNATGNSPYSNEAHATTP
jgi:transcriptional regulator CtsR